MTRPGDDLPGQVGRRRVLAGAAAIALVGPLAGCLPGTGDDEPDRPDPDLLLRARVAAEVRALAEQYAAVIDRHPAAAEELATLAAEHEEHARALLPQRVAKALAAATSTASPTGSPTGSPAPTATPSVAPTLRAARAELAAAETAAARRRTRQAGRAKPETARLLASVAGCEAAHAALLAAGR